MSEIIFHPAVALEVKASYHWYQDQLQGLGDDFLTELESAYEAIAELPETWPRLQRDFRRFLLGKFPYSVIYRLKDRAVFVVAVMHNSRKPDYWKVRT